MLLYFISRWLYCLTIAKMAEKASVWHLAPSKDGYSTSCDCPQQRWRRYFLFTAFALNKDGAHGTGSLTVGIPVAIFIYLFLRYVFADVSNRKPETPYSSFLEGPAPWRLRPGSGVLLRPLFRSWRPEPGWLGGRWGGPRLALLLVRSEGHSQHPLFSGSGCPQNL